jgi:ABC-2 type transport system permease protein
MRVRTAESPIILKFHELHRVARFTMAYGILSLREAAAFRADMFLKLAGYPVRLIMSYFLWRTLLGTGIIQGRGFGDIVSYYLLTFFLTQLYPFPRMARDIREQIYSGDVVIYFSRGVPLSVVWIGRFLSQAVVTTVLITPVAAALLLIVGQFHPTKEGVFSALPLLLIGLVLKGQIWYLLGVSTYFIGENMGVIRFWRLLEDLLSGSLLPLFLYPVGVQAIFTYLPTPYLLYLPVMALIKAPAVGTLLYQLAMGLGWILVLSLVIQLVTIYGNRRLTGHGV